MRHLKRILKRSVLSPYIYVSLDKLREISPNKKSIFGFQFRGPKEMRLGEYEKYLVDFLVPRFLIDTTFVNIGANIGYFASIAKNLGVQRIIAIEPEKTNFKILASNLEKINSKSICELLNIAVGEKNEEGELFGHATGASLLKNWEGDVSKSGIKVQIRSLDALIHEYNIENKSIFLIDVEGSEYGLISSSMNSLSTHSDSLWVIEVSMFRTINGVTLLDTNFSTFLGLFERMGYHIYSWLGDFQLLGKKEIQDLTSGRYKLSALIFVFSKSYLI